MGKLTIELKSFQTIFPQAMDGFEQEHQRFSTTQNQVGYIVEALHSRVKYSYSYFVQSKIDTRKGFRNRKNCETGSIGSAKADVAPLCICLTVLPFLYSWPILVSILLCESMCSMWVQQSYIAVLHLHLWWYHFWLFFVGFDWFVFVSFAHLRGVGRGRQWMQIAYMPVLGIIGLSRHQQVLCNFHPDIKIRMFAEV